MCCVDSGTPMCTNCSAGVMGPACADPCVHGKQVPMDSGNCSCDPGKYDISCVRYDCNACVHYRFTLYHIVLHKNFN